MLKKIFIIILCIFILFSFTFSTFATQNVDTYQSTYVYQDTNNVTTITMPADAPSGIDIDKACIAWFGYDLVMFAPLLTDVGSTYSGNISYGNFGGLSMGRVYNYTNTTYQVYRTTTTNGVRSWYNVKSITNNQYYEIDNGINYVFRDYPFSFAGKDVTIVNNSSTIIFGNFDLSTLLIAGSSSDIQSGSFDYPVIFQNATVDVGSTEFPAYVQVEFLENNTWVEGAYIVLTGNSSLYNSSTNSFYIELKNLIDRDLAVGDKFKIFYSFSTVDRLGNVHQYDLYNIYTRSNAYTYGSSYEPAPQPGDTPDEPSTPDYTNTLSDISRSLNETTQAVQGVSSSVDSLHSDLLNENVTSPNSIGVNQTTVDNTPDLTNFYNTFSGAFHSIDDDKVFVLDLPNGSSYTLTVPSVFVRTFIQEHPVLNLFLSSIWWVVLGGYVVFDFKKMYNKFKTGDLQTVVTNNSPIDNVVKEILR